MLRPGRVERSPLAVLSPGVLFCIILAAVSASVPVLVDNCPDYIDCAKKGRHFCKQGSSHCGPCLASLEEDNEGHCVSPKRRPHHSKETSLTDLDQEIDYLSSIIAKQQVSDVNQPAMSQPVSASWSSPQSQSDGGKNPSRPKNMSHSATAMPASNGPSTVSQHTSSPTEPGTDHPGRSKHIAMSFPRDSLLILITSVCIIMGTVAIILAIVCWVRLQKEAHLAEKVDYPAFPGAVASSRNISPGDKNLAHSAQMYHYQHQKQQMLSLEKNKSETKLSESGVSDEENEEGDFTVYECPGLAPTGEMEVKNPLFDDFTLHPGRNHK
ncbi:neural proliferation differentiation and control protein 1a [Electrophorus electricus]|uniref:Neural proliferation, differentiation and control, 1a n=1 Tax=Electrophorus electricus TaxID=8005 RepID=A0A4W4GDC2_ELEEL|nr:neural proliferation differentiation and control protein 1a [Electrophorus electricus]